MDLRSTRVVSSSPSTGNAASDVASALASAAGSDVELARAAADIVSQPRRDKADSFVLHAPLELAARMGLLPWVGPAERNRARERMAEVTSGFQAFGPAADPPRPLSVDSPAQAARHLAAALAHGDLDDTDAAAAALARIARPAELPALLADAVLPRLAAAGHAPIFLHLLPRVAPRGELPVSLLRPLARELARQPDWRLTWFEPGPQGDGPDDLAQAIRSLPHLGINGSTFIYPTMAQVEATGVAARHLGRAVERTAPAAATAVLARLAALSMLVESNEHGRYGWSHALTMPQGALSVAAACRQPRTAVAVAATFLAGFRTSLGTVDLSTPYHPDPPGGDLAWALAEAPSAAAAAVWHTAPAGLDQVRTILATAASVRHDAHLVKYTLACLDAAHTDPAAAILYLTAAAKLLANWVADPDPLD